MKVYKRIANLLLAINNCEESGNREWYEKHQQSIEEIMGTAPSGSGFDNGTRFIQSESFPNRLLFTFSYHHMNEVGFYTHWSEHRITVTPSLAFGFDMKITKDKASNLDRDYFFETFEFWLNSEVEC